MHFMPSQPSTSAPQPSVVDPGAPHSPVHRSRVLCAWLSNWPIQRLVVQQPELRHRQIVLFGRDRQRGRLVTAASPLARQTGVCPGMPVAEAKSLLRRSGDNKDFFLLEHDLNRDQQAIEGLCQTLENFSPIVGLETIAASDFKDGQRPETLLLDITGLGRLFGDEVQLARLLIRHLEAAGYWVRAAVTDTVGSAWAAAHFLADSYFRQHQQPLVIAPGDHRSLENLPVQALRLDGAVVDTLAQLGIQQLNQLLQIPPSDLAMRFGQAIHSRLNQFFGDAPEPIVAVRSPAKFSCEQLIEYPTRHCKTIEVVIGRQVDQICRQLRDQQQGSLQWQVRLECTGGPVEFSVGLFQPSTNTDEIMPLVQMQLESWLQTSNGSSKKRQRTALEVHQICVAVTSHALLVHQQRDLFDAAPQLDKRSLSHLINRLAGRLGDENVVYPTLQSGAQPEYSFRLKPLVGSRRRQQPPRSGSHRLARPIRLYRPPQAIEVKSPVFQESKDQESKTRLLGQQLPTAITIGTTSYRIDQAWGPERIETGWWRGRTVCRDYWRIAVHTGQQFWIYRDLRRSRWWLHGQF